MASANVEKLLDRYFEGETTLQEEAQLQGYFAQGDVPPHMAPYASMFQSFAVAREEHSTKQIELPIVKRSAVWVWSIAASLVIALGIGSIFMFQNNGLTAEQEHALTAYNEAKQTMLLLSENFNKGASKMNYINTFKESTSNIKYINEFTETTSKIIK